MREADIAWAAGIFEGEGSFTIQRMSTNGELRYATLGATIQMTDRDVVERFQQIMLPIYPTFVREYTHNRVDAKTLFVWSCKKLDSVVKVSEAFFPWLGERRKARFIANLRTWQAIATDRGRETPVYVLDFLWRWS